MPRHCVLASLFVLQASTLANCGGTAETSPVLSGNGGTGGSADSGTDSDSSVSASLIGQAFDLRIQPGEDAGFQCQGPCIPATLLVTKVSDSSLQAVWGATDRAVPLTLSKSGSAWNLAGTLQVGTVKTWDHAMCANETILGPASFEFADHDKDGRVDLVIQGNASSLYCSDDYSTTTSGTLVFVGSPDSRVGKVLDPASSVEPVHGVSLRLDKPLEPSATASLVTSVGGGATLPLTPKISGGFVLGFETGVVLALGTPYSVQIAGKDFAGVGTPTAPAVTTLSDFGVLSQDGFESGSSTGLSGGKIVDSYGVAALHGQRMLLVSPGERSILHLQRAGAEQNLVMDIRKFSACWGNAWDGPLEITVGVVGGEQVQGGSTSMNNSTTVQVETGQIAVGELATLTIPLLDAGKDVLLYVLGDSYQGAGCSKVGALIDDVVLK